MTRALKTSAIGDRLPSAGEQAAARQLCQLLAAREDGDNHKLRITEVSGQQAEIVLTTGIASLFIELLEHISKGDAVTLVPFRRMLSTQQAAEILNVSRPFLISILDKKDISHVRVGRHRRIRSEDLLAYKRSRDAARSAALDKLALMDADLI